MRRRNREYQAMAEINVTNLVDVVLVLLIIFMISAPLLQSGIEIDLPKTRAAGLDEEATGVVVSVDDNLCRVVEQKHQRLAPLVIWDIAGVEDSAAFE